MQSFRRIPTRALLAGALAAILSNAAQADVIIAERMNISGAGMMKMANMNGTTTTSISGQRARTDSNLHFESGLIQKLAHGAGGDSTEIVRLDEDKMYSIDNSKKTYTETTFAEARAQMAKMSQQTQEAQATQQQRASGVDDSQCEWSEPQSYVIRSGEKTTIGGYQAERVTATALQSCKDKKTGQVCDFGMVFDQWVAPDFKASEEVQAYQRAFAQKVGLGTAGSRDFAERAESMFGRYKGMWGEVSNQMRNVKGYPVKLSFALGVGGPQCQSTQDKQAGGQQPSTSSSAGLGQALGGAIGGMFGKKKVAPAPDAGAPPAQLPGGLVPLMGMSTELVSVSTDKIDPQSFEPPTGYKKVAAGQ